MFDPPTLITQAHDATSFVSGEPVLDDWLRRRALANLREGASRPYVVCPKGTKAVIGYFSLSMAQILAQDVTGSMRRNMPSAIPAVLLGRLATHCDFQGRGLGTAMLADSIRRVLIASHEVSARLLIVHAISPAAEAFYLRHGFTRLPLSSPTLALDLIKFQKLQELPSP